MSKLPLPRIVDYFAMQVQQRPHSTALLYDSVAPESDHGLPAMRAISWQQLARIVDCARTVLTHYRVPPKSHIASWLPNGSSWIAWDLASQLHACVHVAIDTRLPVAQAASLLIRAEARIVITNNAGADQLTGGLAGLDTVQPILILAVDPYSPDAFLPLCQPTAMEASIARVRLDAPTVLDDQWGINGEENYSASIDGDSIDEDLAAQILYTSGTMDSPKGVVLSHRNLTSNALAKLAAAPQSSDDVRLNVLPFAHAYARTCELSTWIISGSTLCMARGWDHALAMAPLIRPTLINLVPHLAGKLAALLDQSNGLGRGEVAVLGDRLRLLQVGGAGLKLDVWDRLALAGWPPLQGYGLTESSPVICSNLAGQQRPGTVGPPVDGVEVRLDEQSVLWTRGPHVMLGYWREPDETHSKIRDGWLCTSDVAEFDERGHLRILGRIDDQITLSTGYKAAPLQWTRRLADDPWVYQLVVVGQNRPYLAALVYPCLEALPDSLYVSGQHAWQVGSNSVGEKQSVKQSVERSVAQLDVDRFEKALVQRWNANQSDLPRNLRIETIGLLLEPLSQESGGLNFKGAIRRQFVEQILLPADVEKCYTRRRSCTH